MQVAKISDNTVEEIGELSSLFPNTSFPASGPNEDWYTENSVMPVTIGLSCDRATQKIESVDPYISDGVVYTVRVVDLSADEQTAYTNAQNEALAATQRKRRDALLAETDWMAIKASETGVALADDWKAYRQALRDLPSHSNWPDLNEPDMEGNGTNDWPVKPTS